MQKIWKNFFLLISFCLSATQQVHAHEVYVLKTTEIAKGLTTPLNPFTSLYSLQNVIWFLFFAVVAIVSLWVSFRISFSPWGIGITKQIEKGKVYALFVVRIFLGISLLFSAYFSSVFGPELPLQHLPNPQLWQFVLYISGILITLGLLTRIVAFVLVIFYGLSVTTFGSYMLTYSNYLGEIIVLLLVGGEAFSLDSILFKKTQLLTQKFAPLYTIPLLRFSFALSLLYAAIYAKFLHTMLSLDVVMNYHLTHYFPFDPLFIVFGAGCIEVTIAILFFLGINMRWNIFFFAFWATLSLVFFGESVWPHAILFGICIGLFLYGYDQYTLEKTVIHLFKKKKKITS